MAEAKTVVPVKRGGSSIIVAPRRVHGSLQAVDLQNNTCRIYTDKRHFVSCSFDDSLKQELRDALGFIVDVSGMAIVKKGKRDSEEIKGFVIERIEDEELDFEALGLKKATIQDLLNSDIVGMWKDRTDLDDDFVRRLRE